MVRHVDINNGEYDEIFISSTFLLLTIYIHPGFKLKRNYKIDHGDFFANKSYISEYLKNVLFFSKLFKILFTLQVKFPHLKKNLLNITFGENCQYISFTKHTENYSSESHSVKKNDFF